MRLIRLAILLSLPLGLTACDTAYMASMEKMGYAKRDVLSSRSKSARDAQDVQVDQLVKEMNRSIPEMDKFIQSMGKEQA